MISEALRARPRFVFFSIYVCLLSLLSPGQDAVAVPLIDNLTLTYENGTNTWSDGTGDVPANTNYEIASGVTLTFVVPRSTDIEDLTETVEYRGNLSGEGAVVKAGDGGLFLLFATNSYTGGTRIEGGALAGFLQALSGDVRIQDGIGNTTPTMLQMSSGGTETYEGNLEGQGWFTKAGDGTIIFDADNYTNTNGDIYITGGEISSSVSMIPADVIFNVPITLPGRDVIPSIPGIGDLYGTDPTLEIPMNAEATLAGQLRGAGKLIKAGAGTLILTGANSYSNGTYVRDGAIQGSAGSVQGDIDLDPTVELGHVPSDLMDGGDPVVEFVQSSSGTHSGKITGTLGSLVKAGAGTLSLRGANDYGGGTKVLGGGLNVTTSSLLGDVKLGFDDPEDRLSTEATQGSDYGGTAVLIFDQDTGGTYSGAITGTGNLEKRGSGVLTLAARQQFIGTTFVSGGALDLQAAVDSPIAVGTGGVLSGTGTSFGLLTLAGTVVPGNLDTQESLTVTGASFQDGSTLVVEVAAAPAGGQADGYSSHLQVNGQVTFEPDGTTDLFVTRRAGDYGDLPWTYTIVTAAGGFVNADADSVRAVDISYLGRAVPNFVGNELRIAVFQDELSNLPATANQQQVLDVLVAYEDCCFGTVPNSDMDYIIDQTKLASPLFPQYPLDALNGEGHVDFITPRFAMAAQFSELLSERMYWARLPEGKKKAGQGAALGGGEDTQAAFGGAPGLPGVATAALGHGFLGATRPYQKELTLEGTPWGGWMDFSGVFGDLDGDGNSSGVDYNLYGVNVGVDYRLGESGLVGLALGYNYTDVDVENLLTTGSINTGQVALYGRYDVQRFQVGGALRWAYDGIKSKRELTFFDRTANGTYSGQQYSALVETSYRVFEEGSWQIQPLGSFQYTRVTQRAFTERDAGAANLELPWSATESLLLGLGGRFYYRDIDMGKDYRGTPELRLRWTHEFGDTDRILSPRMIGAGPLGEYTVVGVEIPRDSFVGGVGWAVHMENALSVYANYDITVNDVQLQHVISVGARVNW